MLVLKNPVGLETLKGLSVVRPAKAGNIWKGVPHYDVASSLIESLNKKGMEVTSGWFSTRGSRKHAEDHARMAGVLDVKFPDNFGVPAINGMKYTVGLLHANDMTKSIRIFCGALVTVCLNGVIIGQMILKRKHTSGLSLMDELSFASDKVIEHSIGMGSFVNTMKSANLKDDRADHILMESARKGVIPWSQLRSVWKEYKDTSFPQHEDFKKNTAWSLYNAATYIAQSRPEEAQATEIYKLKDIILAKAA